MAENTLFLSLKVDKCPVIFRERVSSTGYGTQVTISGPPLCTIKKKKAQVELLFNEHYGPQNIEL